VTHDPTFKKCRNSKALREHDCTGESFGWRHLWRKRGVQAIQRKM
jgi:hypothetical protein